jgi:hypothetical protein
MYQTDASFMRRSYYGNLCQGASVKLASHALWQTPDASRRKIGLGSELEIGVRQELLEVGMRRPMIERDRSLEAGEIEDHRLLPALVAAIFRMPVHVGQRVLTIRMLDPHQRDVEVERAVVHGLLPREHADLTQRRQRFVQRGARHVLRRPVRGWTSHGSALRGDRGRLRGR